MADLEKLIESHDRAREEFRTIGDMRPGSLQRNLTRCGEPNCRCAEDKAARHPGTILTRSIDGDPLKAPKGLELRRALAAPVPTKSSSAPLPSRVGATEVRSREPFRL